MLNHYTSRSSCGGKLLFLLSKLISLNYRNIHSEAVLGKGVLKRCACSKITGAHPCQSVISIKLLGNSFEITLCHGCSSVNLLHIFRTPFPKNTSGWLPLSFVRDHLFMIIMKNVQFLHFTLVLYLNSLLL